MGKKIVFLISRFLDGGIDTVLTEYLSAIDTKKYEVVLGIGIKMEGLEVYGQRIPSDCRISHMVNEEKLIALRRAKIDRKLTPYEKIWDEAILNPRRKRLIRMWLEKECRNAALVVDFDSTFYTPLGELKKSGKLPHIPIVGFYHFSISENMHHSRRHTLRQMNGMAYYDHIVLICDAMMEEGKRLFPGLSSRFSRIYNGFDFMKMEQRALNPIATIDPPYFLSVARLEESQKDTATLLKAFARFKKSHPGREILRLIGKGKDENYLRNMANDLGIADSVVFMGFVSDPLPWIKNALATVLSSNFEGLPTVLLESLCAGTPTIASDCPTGPKEILGNGEYGLLFPVKDFEALAEEMDMIVGNKEYREIMRRKALEGRKRFDIRESIESLMSFTTDEEGESRHSEGQKVAEHNKIEKRECGISVVMNTYQAEKYIDKVLHSVSWADEIVIVDMHSNDKTCEIAQRHGARIIFTERARYCEPARNLAIKSAKNKWVLVLDADEEVPESLSKYLMNFVSKEDAGNVRAIRIPRRNRFMGKEIHSLYPDYVTRFLWRDAVEWPKEIHSQPIIDGSVISIPHTRKDLALIHLEENTLDSRREKIERYTEFEVQRRGARKYSKVSKIAKPAMRFVRSYLFKGGWRDGMAGLEWAKLEAEYKKMTIKKQEDAFLHVSSDISQKLDISHE